MIKAFTSLPGTIVTRLLIAAAVLTSQIAFASDVVAREDSGVARNDVNQAAALLVSSRPPILAQVSALLEDAVQRSVGDANSLGQLSTSSPQLGELAALLTLALAQGENVVPSVTVEDLDGTLHVLLVSYDHMPNSSMGLPVLAFYAVNGSIASAELTPGLINADDARDDDVRLAGVFDPSNAGHNVLLLAATRLGGSGATTTRLGLVDWDGAKFVSEYLTSVNDWGGPADWQLTPTDSGYDLTRQCPAFGVFDHKLFAHPTLTSIYHSVGGTFVLGQTMLSMPASRRDAFNRGEVAFRDARYSDAIKLFDSVLNDPGLQSDPESTTDWSGVAWLRIGQSQALSGDIADAKRALTQAEASGGDIQTLAAAFESGLAQPDGPVAAFANGRAALARLSGNTAGANLGFEVDPRELFLPGFELGAFLNAHPEFATAASDRVRGALGQLGLEVGDVAMVDLRGDGQPAIVALLPSTAGAGVWVVSRSVDGWVAQLPAHPDAFLANLGAPYSPEGAAGEVLPILDVDAQVTNLVALVNGRPSLVTVDMQQPVRRSSGIGFVCDVAEALP